MNKLDITPLTERLLIECYKVGYVAIEITNDNVFGFINTKYERYNSDNNLSCCKKGWPAIWEIVKKLKIGAGCGNSHQYQIRRNSDVTPGFYRFLRWEE